MFVAALCNATLTPLTVAGLIVSQAPVAAILHVLLAFPSGRLKGRVARGLVVAAYVVTIGLRAPLYLFGDMYGSLLEVVRRPNLAHAFLVAQDVAEAIVLVVAAFVLASRLRRTTRAQRRRGSAADSSTVAAA